jgi:hypothetical protein
MNLLQELKLLAKIPNLTGSYKLAKAQVRDKKKSTINLVALAASIL